MPDLYCGTTGDQPRVQAIREREARVIAVWGMATTGIMFSLMVDSDSTLIDDTVDVT